MRVNDGKSSGLGTVLLSMAALALAGMVGTISLIHQVGELGPKVGDIISFDPLESMPRDMKARIAASLADDPRGTACTLDVRTIHANGGSLIIETRVPGTTPLYRVHWAGPRSSMSGADCGTSAELMLSQDDLEVLAMAAGGFGASARKLTQTAFLGSASAAR
jgi:hypothetical protein